MTSADVIRHLLGDRRGRAGLALAVGCGDGSVAIELAGSTGLSVRCVDPDPQAISRVRTAAAKAGVYGTRVSAVVGQLDKLAYPSNSADLVFFGDGLAAGRRGRDLKEIYRVLSPNGVAIIGQGREASAGGADA